jgi:putative NIF3 family GTP cyclohydrolase 1 type 2
MDMKCRDVHEHLKKQGPWVDWKRTTDTFKAGDPEAEVCKVAVAWKASWEALREAHRRGAELLVSHESICVQAVNGSPDPEVTFALPTEKPKFDWLEETGLVVYRCHDVWDRYPEIGIRASWQKGLELGGKVLVDAYPFFVTEIPPAPLGDVARLILKRVEPLGQNGVLVSGDLDQVVSKVATGTGAIVDPIEMRALGADVGVIVDDYYRTVRMGVHTRELDFPTITVNHGVAEEWGMENLSAYLAESLPELEVFHIPQRCAYTVVTG